MVDETIPKKCETLYNKLNTFVESEISRDVTPQISNLNSRINALEPNLVRVKEVNGNISSVSAGGTSTKTFTVPACPSGYGWKYFSTSTGWGTVNSVSLSGTTLTVTLLNVSNSSHNISFSGALVYYPNTIKAEQHISISATNPYLLEGEVTDLVVSLVDEFGLPLANKSVTVSDGSSSYNGITNSQGVYTLSDVSVSQDTTFTATYSSVSDSIVVEYCYMVDYGVTNNNNTSDWNNSGNRLTVTVTDTGKTLTGTSNYGYYITKDYAYTDYIVEFDVVELTDLVAWYVRTSASDTQIVGNLTTLGVSTGDSVKIRVQSNSLELYINGKLKTTIALTIASAPMDFGFRITNQTTKYITYKNFRIKTMM